MLQQMLLPNRFKTIGWVILVPSMILGIISTFKSIEQPWLNLRVFSLINADLLSKPEYFSVTETNITNTIVGVLFIVGALFVGFSREKIEDEYIAGLRLSSLLWAVGVNYILLLLAFLLIYNMAFLTIMVYNMFTVLVIFIARFNYLLYKNKQLAQHEK